MTITDDHTVEDVPALDRVVLAVLHQCVLDEASVDDSTGCMLHPTGRVRWLGGTFVAKRVMFEVAVGPLHDDAMLVRRCAEPDCIEPTHHVAQTRQEFGSWLGRGTGWRARAST